LNIYIVDAFTSKPFSGNPAAVCILESELSEVTMMKIASEMNLSETAFVLKQNEEFNLRWFTPKTEVELCGHGTLASSHILWESGILSPDLKAVFNTQSGKLSARKINNEIELDFPAIPEVERDLSSDLPLLIKTLNYNPVSVSSTEHNYIAEFDSPETIKNIEPDFQLMEQLPLYGLIVTSKADGEFDIVSRFFTPSKGISEDPVTGAAHCALAPYWYKKTGKDTFKAYQASERGGILKLKINGNRVMLTGEAVTILRGELLRY
jgi:PhzF family phenazine biosynthesis protein